jgi:hypothetical protein
MPTSIQIVFDANDPARLADFWALTLGYIIQPPPAGFGSWDDWAQSMGIPEENWNDARALVDPDGAGPRLFFQKVPEGKTAKNRVHLDVNAGGGHETPADERRIRVDAEVERLIAAGASLIGPMEQRGDYWVVLGDPEGNEFCVQ